METILDSGLLWWITVIDIPAMSALFWLIMRHKRDNDAALKQSREVLEVRCNQLREGLLGFKLEVAKTYASIMEMKDVEGRIVTHLLRIESKLDKTALKTEALSARE
ncbi:MAG: hypothetical protein GW903_00810 [Alphaproteobacteria bacterium]|nr:hypothetical protein [Alphaproteobacteria bacterium]NCQ87510.1 hypothetical protein [Alphaproteobacteria bacterium]NCT06379.1 hypothetical protein [Alphaproteobacteria bacterium]